MAIADLVKTTLGPKGMVSSELRGIVLVILYVVNLNVCSDSTRMI